ncbi:MAG: hypothetical protein ACP5IJ_01925 [Candidatus Nanoarchaeia archaeon]
MQTFKLPNKKLFYFPFLGWKTKLVKRGHTYYVAVDKRVLRALLLVDSDCFKVYSYFGLDEKQRPVVIVFLDSKNFAGNEEKE